MCACMHMCMCVHRRSTARGCRCGASASVGLRRAISPDLNRCSQPCTPPSPTSSRGTCAVPGCRLWPAHLTPADLQHPRLQTPCSPTHPHKPVPPRTPHTHPHPHPHTHASSSHVELCTLLTYRLTLGGAVHGGSPAAAAAAAPATSLGPHSATAALARHLGGTPASLPAHSHRHIWLQCVSYSVAAFVACGCSLCHVRLQALFATGSFISVREMSGVAGVPELGCELLQLLNCLAYLGPQAFPTDATFESFAYELVS